VPSLHRPVAPAGGVPVEADVVVEALDAACVSLLDEEVAAPVDEVVFEVDFVEEPLVEVLLVEASAAPYHSLTP
jgi:hypothetical protein